MRKLMLVVLAITLLSFIVVGGYANPAQAKPKKDTLIIGIPETPRGFDAESGLTMISHQFLDMATDVGLLYKYGPSSSASPEASGVLVPHYSEPFEYGIFERYEVSPDWKTITWHIRPGVKSAYGNEFTTEDVKWFMERAFALKATMKSYLDTQDVADMSQIKIIDKYTWSMTSKQPNPMLLYSHLSFYYVFYDSTEAKKHITANDPWANQYIDKWGPGFGPYYVTKWEAGKEIVFKANPNYWGEPPKQFTTVIYRVIPGSSSRVSMLKDGTIDVADSLSFREYDSLRKEPGIRVYAVPEGALSLSNSMNWKYEMFKNKFVRQAVIYATPRQDICDTAFYGFAKPWQAWLPHDYPCTTGPDDWPYSYDLNKAKELLAKGGYPNGFSSEFVYQAGLPYHETLAIMIKDSLGKVGIDVQLRKLPAGAFATALFNREYPMTIQEGHSYHVDPSHGCFLWVHEDAFTNFSNYSNEELSKMIEEGRAITDLEKRCEFHKEIQRKVMKDPSMNPVVQIYLVEAARDNIKGWNASFGPNFKWNWMYTE